LRAIDWFDNGLQNVRVSQGFTALHRTQSLILVHIASGMDQPADIAREMGLTRQNVHHMAESATADRNLGLHTLALGDRVLCGTQLADVAIQPESSGADLWPTAVQHRR